MKAIYRRALANIELGGGLDMISIEENDENINRQLVLLDKAKKDIEFVLERDYSNDIAKNKLQDLLKQ